MDYRGSIGSASPHCRLAVVASHPVQYFTPLYRRLAATPGIELDVFFCSDFGARPRFDKQFGRTIAWDAGLLNGYRHEFLRSVSPIHDPFNPIHAINPTAFTRLLSGYDALWVNGYLYPSNWLAAAAAKLRHTALIMRSELRPFGVRAPKRTDPLRNAVLRWWIRRCDALLYIGEDNRRAYVELGAREEQLFFCPYSADVDRIRDVSQRVAANRDRERESLSIPLDKTLLLFVGKLIPMKNPHALQEIMRDDVLRQCTHVVYVGSGPLEAELRASAARAGLNNVSFLGFVNQEELPRYFGIADIFLLPSRKEQWGIVLNEAMAAGLPAVVSSNVGAASDLIHDGVTGFIFTNGDWNQLAERTRRLVLDPALRSRIGAAALARAAEYSYDASVRGILAALRSLGRWRAPVSA